MAGRFPATSSSRDTAAARRAHPLPLIGASARYWPCAFSAEEAQHLFAQLCEQVAWDQHRLRMFGRDVNCPRLSSWYGDPESAYGYSGMTLEPRPWIAPILCIRERVEQLVGEAFNGVLLNLYRDGRDSVGWHADDETDLGSRPLIASVSFGAVRRFCLRDRVERDRPTFDVQLAHGSLLLLERDLQSRYQHCLPKTRKEPGPRVNLTFRQVQVRGGAARG